MTHTLTDRDITHGLALHKAGYEALMFPASGEPNLIGALRHQAWYRALDAMQTERLAACDVGGRA